MRVVVCRAFGPPESLEIEQRPSVSLTDGQVRVAVDAAGVNFVDALIVEGRYQVRPPTPFVPGNEIAGHVIELGAGVADVVVDGAPLAVGDRVVVPVGLGGFASEVVVPARAVLRTPNALTDPQAATFLQSYMTAWFALRHRARAVAGQRLLVLGAGGGVGLAAVDVATSMGLRVIAAASSDDKRALACARGAEAVVDTSVLAGGDARPGDLLKSAVREWGGGGVDLVYDPVGGVIAEPALRCLDDDGQYLVVGFAAGEIPRLPANQVLLRNRRVVGVDWGGWVGRHQTENRAMLAEVCAAVDRGDVHPVEPVAYPLERVAEALRAQLERRVVGKSVLLP